MALQFNGGPFAGSYTTNTFNTGKAQPMPPPSQGTPYGGNVFQGNLGRQPPQWNMGDDIRRPPSNPAPPPMPPAQQPGRVMDGPGSGYGPVGGFPPPPTQPPPVSFRPGQASPIQPQVEESPEEYRRSIAAERARAAKMDSEAAAKRQKMLQDRQGVKFPEYENRIYDPVVIQNELDKRAAQAKAAARGETPRKTQGELDMEEGNRSHLMQKKAREDISRAYPNLPPNERYRMESYVMAGDSIEDAYKNSGAEFAYSQRAAIQQEQEQKIREFQSPEYRARTLSPEPGMSGRPGWGSPRSSNPPTAARWR